MSLAACKDIFFAMAIFLLAMFSSNGDQFGNDAPFSSLFIAINWDRAATVSSAQFFLVIDCISNRYMKQELLHLFCAIFQIFANFECSFFWGDVKCEWVVCEPWFCFYLSLNCGGGHCGNFQVKS